MSGAGSHAPVHGAPGESRGPAPAAPAVTLDVALELVGGRARLGCKGPAAEAWLQAAGLDLPPAPNSFTGDANLLVARLGSAEFFVEAAAGAQPLAALELALQVPPTGVYPVLREDWTLALVGADVHAVLAEVCNVNFAALAPQSRGVVMTLMVGVAVLVARRDAGGPPAYTIWCDPSFGPYLSETLGAVVTEYGGTFKGGAA